MSAWNQNDGNTRLLRTLFGKRQRKEIIEKIMKDMNDKRCGNHTEQKLKDGECCQTKGNK